MWANDPEMAEKWEKEEKSESRNMRVTENELRGIVRRTLLSEQDITAAIKMLMGSLDDNQRAELAASMSDPSKPTGPSGPSGPKEEEVDVIPTPEIEELLDDPEKQDDALDAISQDPSAMADMVADNPDAIEDAVGANPDMLQGFLEDPSIMDKLEGMLAGSDFLKGILGKVGGPEAAAALGELGENTVRLTRRQLRQIIKEGIDIVNSETGELLIFEDDWEEGGGHAPEAAAREIMKRLGVAQISSEIDGDIEDIQIAPEDWARMEVEIQGKRHYRRKKKNDERMDVNNLLVRVDQWATDAGGDYGADNPSIDMQDVSWDLAAGAKYEFREDEWDELIWHFDDSEDELITYIADRIAG